MIVEFGAFALILALVLSVLQTGLATAGRVRRSPLLAGGADGAAIVGIGAAACAVCCAGPILAFLAAIGLGTAAGVAFFGIGALVVGAAAVALVLWRRRRRQQSCAVTAVPAEVPVELVRTPTQR